MYAQATSVPIERSKAEIERLVSNYGAQGFMSAWTDKGKAAVEFYFNDRRLRFVVKAPDTADPRFTHRKYGSSQSLTERPEAEARKLWEQACRALWRALLLCIKAKLEAVESGITTFEVEFMPYTVLPNGRTAGEHLCPMIADAYESGKVPPMLTFEG